MCHHVHKEKLILLKCSPRFNSLGFTVLFLKDLLKPLKLVMLVIGRVMLKTERRNPRLFKRQRKQMCQEL